jgi:uncharacterized protein (DUF1778 family)
MKKAAPKRPAPVSFRGITADDRELWKRAAEAEGRSLSGWIRWHLNRAASRILSRK